MGNPEILLTLEAPATGDFPMNVTVSAPKRSLLYMHDAWIYGTMVIPSSAGYKGGYTFTFNGPGEQRAVRLGNHPDSNDQSKRQALTIKQSSGPAKRRVPVYVCDQDQERANEFEITIESESDATGFFDANPRAHRDLQRIADDLAYYLASMSADSVAAGGASTRLADGRTVSNVSGYTGMVLKAAGWTHGDAAEDVWSTGYPGSTRLTSGGVSTDVFAIGTLGPHPDGDRSAVNTSGWKFSDKEKLWYRQGYTQTGKSPTDDCPAARSTCDWYHVSFYSVQKHEMLHALGYERSYPLWDGFFDKGCIDAPELMAYTGRCSPLADTVHAWDPVLHRREWNQGPELIDKFELLVMQAVGWELRDTTPFQPLAVADRTVIARRSRRATPRIEIEGGVAPYDFQTLSGTLPAGLSLNRFTGEFEGSTEATGSYEITVQILDNGVDEILFFPSDNREVPANGIIETITVDVR